MKKILSLVLCLVLALLCVGCSAPDEGGASSDIPTSKPDTSSAESTVKDNGFKFDTSSLSPTKNPLTVSEAKEIFEPLVAKGIQVHEAINNDCLEYDSSKPLEGKSNYYLLKHDSLKTIEDVWEFAYSAYDEKTAKRLFSAQIEDPLSPRFIESNGNLYYYAAGHGHDFEIIFDSLDIIEQYENVVILSMDYTGFGDTIEKCVFIMTKTENGWRLSNSETEACDTLLKQFRAKQ